MNKPTCGPMYKEALERYAGDDAELIRIFAAGFVSGQAEKVYLGACRAAMFRPSQDRYGMLIETVRDVAQRYGLTVVEGIGSQNEIWVCRPDDAELVRGQMQYPENSPPWHVHRATLCGVDEIDVRFHLRAGSGERCD